MIRTPQELSEPIRNAVNRRAVVFSHILMAITITGHTYLATDSGRIERTIAVGMSVGLIGLILFRVFDLASVNSRPLTYLTIYYVLTFFGFTLVSDASTPYVAGFFFLVFLTNLYYGSRGVLFSIGFFGLVTLSKYLYFEFTTDLSTNDRLNIIAAFLIFAAASSFFINIQKVFDWDHERVYDESRKAVLEASRLRTLINNLTESVLVLDKTFRVRMYNAAALALFDTNVNLEGKTAEEFSKFKDDKGNQLTIEELMPEGPNAVSRDDIQLFYTEEDFASISLTITPIQTSFGHEDEDTGFIVTMRDITRMKSLEEERNEFISVISHELRTPVTVTEASISNAMIINDKGINDEKISKSLTLAHDQAIFLANMLNDLSTFARAEKNTLQLDLEDFSPAELVTVLENDYRREAEVKGIQIRTIIDSSTPEKISSNRLYVREILQNFITNAIKYSDTGTVTLKVASQDGKVKFDVVDQGIGISTSDQKRVFDKFFRSEGFETRSRNGTGLGLYIVRKLAKIIDATFELNSEIGKGSTFSVIVPDLSNEKTS